MTPCSEFTTEEWRSMLEVSEALSSSLNLAAAFQNAVPSLRGLLEFDHAALALSRPGTLDDYEWLVADLPPGFLGAYADIAEHDFVRRSVIQATNSVLRDHQMIDRADLERHIVYQHARASGAPLEHVMAVMLVHGREWSSGLSLYRNRRRAFSDRESRVLEILVPQFVHAVQNARAHAALRRATALEAVVGAQDVGVLWLDDNLRELDRTRHTDELVARFFPDRAPGCQSPTSIPEALLEPLRRMRSRGSACASKCVPMVTVGLSTLSVQMMPSSEPRGWALVLHAIGPGPTAEARLTPRLTEIARAVMDGLSNEAIAARDGRSLATIKQQVSEVYARLGVSNRGELMRMAHHEGAARASTPNGREVDDIVPQNGSRQERHVPPGRGRIPRSPQGTAMTPTRDHRSPGRPAKNSG